MHEKHVVRVAILYVFDNCILKSQSCFSPVTHIVVYVTLDHKTSHKVQFCFNYII